MKCLETTGYTVPSEVQRQAVPAALEGRDLLVSSHTGSGKTAAFLLPSLHKLAEPSTLPGNGPRLLVLCPTRELAMQVQKQAMIYGAGLRKLRTVCLVGGAPFGPQFQALKVNPEVMIATPGRLIDHLERGRIDFSRLEVLVLDEADRMLDMGFIEDIEHIVSGTPASRQTLLFSATLDGLVGKIAAEMTNNALRISVVTQEDQKANIDQRILFSDDIGHKHRMLDFLLRDVDLTQALIFTATKRSAEELSETLMEQGHSAAALHGDMPQHKRTRTLQRLRDGQTRFLVATDVAARGIDVAGISHVINFDAPRQAEDYVHRIGRTGRAGRTGIAITMVHGKERHLVREIERYIGQSVRVDVIAGLEPSPRSERPFDKNRGGKSGYGNKSGGYGNKSGYGNSKPWGERSASTDKPAGERTWGDKPAGERTWGEKKWADKPRGEFQSRGQGYGQRDAQAPRHDDDSRGNTANHGAGNAQPRPERNGNTWAKPEGGHAAKPAWVNKSDARPAFKSSGPRTDDHRPAATKPRGRQSW
ncbi:MAG: DEAD/DEAH box helicase [Pseudomonadota bacterium]|nr:DEAD/DEAH box helicase [Pseudomonadota bacterium]MDP1904940.1 DEAD/DEAH box helicase [Pseudomonadota bacterium]MDP2354309.1 DEAD/DEAH box helicase [Pseudomonadota bacterium]